MAATSDQPAGLQDHPIADDPLPVFVDWLLGALVLLGGMIFLVAGSALRFLVDRELLAEAIEEEDITVTLVMTELTDAESLEVADALVTWTGTGLLLVGLVMVLFAIGYVAIRHRAYRRAKRGEPISSYVSFAVLGGFVTVVLSFLPFSPVFGGLLAGYLERGESQRVVSVGALAGLLPLVPIIILMLFVLGGLLSGMSAIDQMGAGIVVAVTLLLSIMFMAVFGGGLGALGGYLGGWFAERRAEK